MNPQFNVVLEIFYDDFVYYQDLCFKTAERNSHTYIQNYLLLPSSHFYNLAYHTTHFIHEQMMDAQFNVYSRQKISEKLRGDFFTLRVDAKGLLSSNKTIYFLWNPTYQLHTYLHTYVPTYLPAYLIYLPNLPT